MKKNLIFICSLFIFFNYLHAESSWEFSTEILDTFTLGPIEEVKPVEEDLNISTSTATLEAGPLSVVAGCVNVMTGSYFDSGTSLFLPGPQPLIIQHTFSNFLSCHFSHKPRLEVGPSKHGKCVHALYTDDNGSGIPFTARLHNDRPTTDYLQLTESALDHLTNYSSHEISGRTRWSNAKMQFVQKNDDKFYYLSLGSGIKRLFERFERIGKKHQPGVPFGYFRLKEERSPNGNRYAYKYTSNSNLRSIQALNKKGEVLATLNCFAEITHCFEHHWLFSMGSMNVMYRRLKNHCPLLVQANFDPSFVIEPSHGISTKYVWENPCLLKKYQLDKNFLEVHFSYPTSALKSEKNELFVKTLLAPVGETAELIPLYHFNYKRAGSYGFTTVKNAFDWQVQYYYHSKYKRLYSISTYDEENNLYCKERFFWHKPKSSSKFLPFHPETHCSSEHLLLSHVLEEGSKRYFCRHFEYDDLGNITKNHLWGNLTGNNQQPILLNQDGLPEDNGCEVYTKILESSKDGFNLPLYEDDGGKWLRLSYYSGTNLLKMRLTGFSETILKREFFEYDDNGSLVKEIWDDGKTINPQDLSDVTERHIRLTSVRQEFPIGLPQTVEEYYCDLKTGQLILIKKLINEHSPEGRIISQQHYDSQDKFAYTLKWKYDRLGNVTKESNALGEEIKRTFDAFGNKIQEIQPNGICKIFAYDHAHRLIEEKEIWPDGKEFASTHRYNYLSQKIATLDSNGHETLFFYDRLGHLKETIKPAIYTPADVLIQPQTKTLYNAMGQAIASCDANGYWTNKDYTIRGQVCRIEYPDGSNEQKEYSLDGLLVKEIAKKGLVTQYAHDPFGRVIETCKYNPEGQLLSCTTAAYSTFHLVSKKDEAGLVTTYSYDEAGRHISTIEGEKVTTYKYDALGRIIKEITGEVVKAKEYDLLDRLIEERTENLAGEVLTKKQYRYDSQGNRTHVTNYSQAGKATIETLYNPRNQPVKIKDALGNETHFTYDTIQYKGQRVNRRIKTDPLGNQEIFIFDTHERICKTMRRNPLGQVIQAEQHFYDAIGNKIQTTTKVYSGIQYVRPVTTSWTYDSMGNEIHCLEAKGTPEQKETKYVYNLYGEKEQIIKPDGTILLHEYDDFGRLSHFTSSDQTIDYTYAYDLKNNPILIEDHIHGTQTHRTYDLYSRLISETLENNLSFYYTYDELDRPLTITLPDQTAIHYHYEGDYLKRIDRIKNGQTVYSQFYDKYDKSENLLHARLPGKAGKIEFRYDLLQRPLSIQALHWQEIIPRNGYDAAGNLLARQVTDSLGQIDYTYTYDDLYQLTTEKGHTAHTFTYDSLCNRLSKNKQPYRLNPLNQLLHETKYSYAYDANGNLTLLQQGELQIQFSYDALDRLIKVKNGQQTFHYRYDSFHRRLSKKTAGLTTHYLYAKDSEIGAFVNGQLKELRILGLGRGSDIGAAVAIELENIPYVPIHDPYGNVVTLLDLKGDIAATYRYTAFGEEQIHSHLTNPWRYASKRVDPETGFIYFGRRYYMPSTGRWITPDPLRFADGLNLYAYVHNRPLVSIDPDGQFAFLVPIAISLALDYFLPTATACLAECAVGGSLAASLLSGFVSGYNDPLSSAFDASTYSIDADLPSFICNRAGMLLGAAIACKPTSIGTTGVKAVANVASREIAGTVISKAETAMIKSVKTSLEKSVRTTAQKTVQVAERNFVKQEIQSGKNIINDIPQKLDVFLGANSKAFYNKNMDLIIESQDGLKQFRMDLNHPNPHKNPHTHLIKYEAKKGKKFEIFNERIFPKGVCPE